MDKSQHFIIDSADHMISAKFTGCWSVATDLVFMNQLCDEINKVKRRGAWAFFVDMREWKMEDHVIPKLLQVKHDLDRRNQKGECWLISNESQGQFLLPFFEDLPFPLFRHYEKNQVRQWLTDTGLSTDPANKLINDMMNFGQ